MAPRPRRLCAFCGNPGKITDEHLWPQWMGKYTQATEPTRSTRSLGFGHQGADTITIYPDAVRERQGSVLGFVAREVCRDCNGGWMSRLEMKTERLVVPLMQGQRVLLDEEKGTALATWATKTAWVNEFIGRPGPDPTPQPLTTPAMRRHLMDHSTPPQHTRVWIAYHQGLYHLDIRAAELRISPSPDPDDPEVYTALFTALTVDKLTILVWTAETDRVIAPRLPASYWHPVWPFQAAFIWPLQRTVNDLAIDTTLTRHSQRHPLPPHHRVVQGELETGIRRLNELRGQPPRDSTP